MFEATACIDYRNEGESSPLYTYPVIPNLAIALCNLVYDVYDVDCVYDVD